MTALSFLLVSKECKEWKTTFLSSFKNHLRARLKVTPSASLTYFEICSLTGKPSGLDAFFSCFRSTFVAENMRIQTALLCSLYIFHAQTPTSALTVLNIYGIVLLMACCFASKNNNNKKKDNKMSKIDLY